MHEEIKRLFFGVEVHAPWPYLLPKGRLLDEKYRHITLSFLGNISCFPLIQALNRFPKISLKMGAAGYFDSCLSLPPKDSTVIAWHAKWLNDCAIVHVQKIVSNWLIAQGYVLDNRPWMPHVTLCRQPFDTNEWKDAFIPLPFYTGAIHLYESKGNLNYQPIWSYPVKAPFEEVDHTADMAFIIRGENLRQLFDNAFIALAFKAVEFIAFYQAPITLHHLDDIIIALNEMITRVDSQIGSPIKAVSFHGEVVQLEEALLQWEMIVDV